MTDPVGRVRPRSPRRLLEELAGAAERLAATGRPRPRVTLHLTTGRDMAGRLVAVGEDGGAAVAALHIGGDADVAHVRDDLVAAVTVHEPVVPARSAADAPGRLELARQIVVRAQAAAAALGAELPIALDGAVAGDADLGAVGALLAILGDALAQVLADPLGVEAVKRQVDSLRLSAGDESSALLVGRVLAIRAARDELARWTPAELRAAIEKALQVWSAWFNRPGAIAPGSGGLRPRPPRR